MVKNGIIGEKDSSGCRPQNDTASVILSEAKDLIPGKTIRADAHKTTGG